MQLSLAKEVELNTGDVCEEVSSAAVAGRFRKSSFCSNGGCVEIARLSTGDVAIRDSKDPSRSALVYTSSEWRDFISGVKSGEFDFD